MVNGLLWLDRYDYERDGQLEYHPGEDWNDNNSGDDYGNNSNDAGDLVYAIGNGKIVYAKYSKVSWGYVVLIEHTLNNGTKIWSQYAHLANIDPEYLNKPGVSIKRGSVIGWVGDYWHGSGQQYHLHFEIRKKYRPATAFVMNWSKEQVEEYYVNPSEFINNNRPVIVPPEPPKPEITIENLTNSPDISDGDYKIGGGKVIWTNDADKNSTFPYYNKLRYYDLETGENGTIGIGNSLDRIQGPNYTVINNDYFCYAGKDSLGAASNIFCHEMSTGLDIKITSSSYNQTYPALSESNYLVWLDVREGQIYSTNISGSAQIMKVFGTPGYQNRPEIWGSKVVFRDIYPDGSSFLWLSDLATGEAELITTKINGEPDIWEEWISWKGTDGSLNLYSYVTGEDILVTNDGTGSMSLSHDKAVWQELVRGEGWYMSIFDIESRETIKLDVKTYWDPSPYIFDSYIAFKAPTDLMAPTTIMDVWLVKL